MIRPAKHSDTPAIVELAVESVSIDPLPLKIDRGRMTEACQGLIGNPQHFAWVSETGGAVTGAVGAWTQPGFWHERQQCSVLMFYCKSPGDGIALLRQFARWVKSRPAIKVAVFSLERNADPRIEKLLKRLGFGLENKCMSFVRGL